MTKDKIPSTAEEFATALAEAEKRGAKKATEDSQKVIAEAEKRGAEKATEDSQKVIKDLEAKISLIKGNPLEFPRFINEDDQVHELPFLNPIIVDGVEYENVHFTDDKSAEAKFGMKAKDVLTNLFEKRPDIFVKK